MPENAEAPHTGLIGHGKRILSNILELLHNRIELLGVELQEEKYRLIEVLIWGSAAIFLTAISLVIVTVTLVVAVWEDPEHRLIALCGLSVFYVVMALISLLRLKSKIREASQPFRETLRALQKDRQCLNEPTV